jgi:opacity protein-like surface antigen
MKYNLILSIAIILSTSLLAQRKSDFGLFLGGASYVGDINPGKQFYKPGPAVGALIRFNINKRYVLRFNGTYAMVSGNSDDFPDQTLPYRPEHSFTSNLFEFASQLEFNFLPYISGQDKWMNSTYITGGIGYTLNVSAGNGFLSIPFGAGFKINITDRLSAGLEWTYRKTFNDKIDNLESPLGNSILHNNDWYSTYGLLITYKFFKFAADCPVYK